MSRLRAVMAFLSAEAFERRARQRERNELYDELATLYDWKDHCEKREPLLVARLQVLAREDGYQCAPPNIRTAR